MLTVVGTRPEAIKLAPVVQELRRREGFDARLCATAQHRELMDGALAVFDLEPDYDLDVMQERQPLEDVTARLVARLGALLRREAPHVVLVQGDTTTVFAAALAAFYLRIPVGHVEAGLRSGNRYGPFPEDGLRKLTSQLALFHFAPTRRAADNLLSEQLYDDAAIYLTGNPVVDAVRWVASRSAGPVEVPHSMPRMLLVTAHRRENLGEPLRRICRALLRIVAAHPDVEIVYPVHPNPDVSQPVREMLGSHPRIRLLPPQDYVPFIALLVGSYFVLTDSGGVQEEAPVLGKPVLVMREETERPEAVEAGTAMIVGSDEDLIVQTADRLLGDETFYASLAHAESPFGDGHASERIADILEQRLCGVGDGADRHRVTRADKSKTLVAV